MYAHTNNHTHIDTNKTHTKAQEQIQIQSFINKLTYTKTHKDTQI